jgi:hypothetical protein
VFICTTPTGGVGQASAGPPAGPPIASSNPAVVYSVDPGGTLRSMGSMPIYNISQVEAVPAAVMCTLIPSPGGKMICQTWAGQQFPNAVVPGAISQAPGF